eukprot:CAMPEP_0198261074 /NCGR_PEP_ID=MMETSP1447-20131203/9873_1 /TAXON_ID=420782 /ORGANISM="Chaetoceros dichaeta, Strain CCMP1751" /LENGTH=1095 /DNA_ID=CAMNT_0043948879 /DNA_START=58 /DNA_END=3342 /DNA_ORIENTATION=-
MANHDETGNKTTYGAVVLNTKSAPDRIFTTDIIHRNHECISKIWTSRYFTVSLFVGLLGLISICASGRFSSLVLKTNNVENVGIEDTIYHALDITALGQSNSPQAFSKLDPVSDIQLHPFDRPKISRPSELFGKYHHGQVNTKQPLPTNQWYENMFLLTDGAGDPNERNRVYTIPYVVDTVGPIPGIRLFETRVLGMDKIVQVTYVNFHGLTLGATHNLAAKAQDTRRDIVKQTYTLDDDKSYVPMSPLGITLKWKSTDTSSSFDKMTSSIVRGMPYGSMRYQYNNANGVFQGALPTVAAELPTHFPPVVDSNTKLICSSADNEEGNEELVTESVTFSFKESDYTWAVFYSHPVYVRCVESEVLDTPRFALQANRVASQNTSDLNFDDVFISRIALLNNCTHGANPSHCTGAKAHDRSEFSTLIHKHAHVYPGPNTKTDFTFLSDEEGTGGAYSYLHFDWDARHISNDTTCHTTDDADLLIYALPHHRETFLTHPTLSPVLEDTTSCRSTLHGRACLVEGSNWVVKEDLDGQPSFSAPRPPMAKAIPHLADAINKDINYRVSKHFQRGAGDTYFSGKVLAKFSRILLVTEELTNMCSEIDEERNKVYEECNNVTLPSDEVFGQALDHLRSSTEIWINGTADTPFVYDTQWGGLVSCGCLFNDTSQKCNNVFPDCPAFSDKGLDFGHGFYNDHHYHQGYHIYAAATVAHFDPAWGTKHFEEVLLLIRDIANPSPDDVYFPTYRMKDWYLGNSWAGGIGALFPNGRNQESVSEAIAAYEAVSLFGQVMVEAWEQDPNTSSVTKNENAAKARNIRDIGRLLTATELRSADRYWHLSHSKKKERVYPEQYTPLVVGMLWNMMAQFQTWFGNAPHLAYGIQLLPLTPVAEKRDKIEWAKELYPSFAKSCRSSSDCDAQGWGILQHAILATVGHADKAIQYAEKLPKEVFETAGGNGHSLTNTIWYYATRPKTEPLILVPEQDDQILDCGCPDTCTTTVLNSQAVGYTCGERIQWLIQNDGKSEREACENVAGGGFADDCSGCDPHQCAAPLVSPTDENQQCPICSDDICEDTQLNKCPVQDAPFLCTEGASSGGCSPIPW